MIARDEPIREAEGENEMTEGREKVSD